MKLLSLIAAQSSVLIAVSIFTTSQTICAQSTSLDPAVQAALSEGTQFEQRHQLSSALDSDRRALKLAKGVCTDCYQAIVNLQLKMELTKDAASSASAWAAHASAPIEKSHAEYLQAEALVDFYAQKHNPSLLHQADEVLKHAAADNPADPTIPLLHGRVFATLNMDAEAKAEFTACAAAHAATPADCTRATNFAHDVSLARGDMAPAFTIARPDGSSVTLDSLAGKVVLIDFWATWCPPCNKDLDYIQSIAKEFKKDQFVLLGISSDSNEEVWKHYREDNKMVGIQVRDSFEGVRDLFHVSGIPTYIVLDANGMIRLRVTGPEGDIRGKVRSLLAGGTTVTQASPQTQNTNLSRSHIP